MPDRPKKREAVKKTVLVLEDQPSVAEALKTALEDRGCHVSVSGTVATAKAAFAGQGWDVVVADYDLPDGNGCEFLDWCAQLDGHAPRFTVLFSGLSRDGEVKTMVRPPDEIVMKDRLPELIDLVAAQ